MTKAIKEISALELAEKIESGAELATVERTAAGAMLRHHHLWKEKLKEPRSKRFTDEQMDTIIERKEAGESWEQIAPDYKVKVSNLASHVSRYKNRKLEEKG